jgi:hypothetical protein
MEKCVGFIFVLSREVRSLSVPESESEGPAAVEEEEERGAKKNEKRTLLRNGF